MLQQPKRKKVGSELESNNEGISETPSDIVLPATARPGASGIDISTSTSDVMAAVSKSTEPAGILSVATAINTSLLSNAKVNEATSVKNVDVNEQLDVPTTVYKKNPNDQGQNLEDADNSETERIDAQEALLIRRRAMNTIHSRRKRERQRIEIEVLKEQCSEYTKKNLLIQQENTQLEVIIANAKATVEQRERLGAMNISLFQQHQQQQLMPQQQQQQLHQPQQSVYNTAPMSIMPQSQQQNSTASLLQLLQQQMNQSLQGSVNTMYVPSVQQQMQQHQPVYNNPPIHNQMVQHQVSATGNNIVQSEHQYADQIHNAIRQQITLLQQQQPNVVAHGLANTDASTSNAAASIQNIVQQLAMNNTSGSGNNDNVPGSHSLQYHQYQHQQQNQAMMMPQQMSTQQQHQLLLAQQWYLQQQIQLQLQQQQLPPSHQNQDRNYNADTGAPSNPP